MKAIVKDNHMNYNGINYFRVNSEDVYMGAYGQKKSPILQGNYLSVEDGIPVNKLKVKEAVTVVIDFEKSSEKNFLANINVAGVFGGSAGTAYTDVRNGRLHLVKLTIDEADLESAINDSPKHLDKLRSIGGDARISSDIFVVMDSSETKSFISASSMDVTVNAGIVNVSTRNGAGSSGSTTVRVSNGSVFAYGLSKIKKWNKDKTRIEDLEDDQWGPV